MTNCPKCGSPWRRVHPNDTLEGLDDATQYLLARQVICTNQECSYQWALSPMEIINHYYDLMKTKGMTKEQAEKDLFDEHRKTALEPVYRCEICGNLQRTKGACLECGTLIK